MIRVGANDKKTISVALRDYRSLGIFHMQHVMTTHKYIDHKPRNQ